MLNNNIGHRVDVELLEINIGELVPRILHVAQLCVQWHAVKSLQHRIVNVWVQPLEFLFRVHLIGAHGYFWEG